MAKKKWAGTPAQKAALRKAQQASARARRGRSKTAKASKRRLYGTASARGTGVAGLQRNAVPYARINKRSGTLGANTGSIIPFTGKRIVTGGYVRIENVSRKNNPVDRLQAKVARGALPAGTKRGAVRKYFNENVTVSNPAVRANVGGAQVRLGTSRGAGATLIVRRGRHKTAYLKSRSGVRNYDSSVRKIAGKRAKTRRARRGK